VKVAEKFLSEIPVKRGTRVRTSPIEYFAKDEVIEKNNNQAHVAIGRPSFALNHPSRLPFFALVNLLGGPGMNSRFNLSLREKHGLVYQIEAGYTSYYDTGKEEITNPVLLDLANEMFDDKMLSKLIFK
jgi:predicted Zn-dependent peptidase